MKRYSLITTLLLCLFTLSISCEDLIPESRLDNNLREDQSSTSYERLRDQGITLYDWTPTGYDRITGAMLASASDEAEFAIPSSDIEKFNNGSWSQITNPEDTWGANYRGIRLVNLFLQNSENYKHIIVRDTTKQVGKDIYKQQCDDLEWLRNEARVLRAYFYFELIKRYGGVPIIKKAYSPDQIINVPRNTYDEVTEYIKSELNEVIPHLQANWKTYKNSNVGRIEKGMAMALKARVLLYWASPLNNPQNDINRWREAAQAAFDVISLNRYSLDTSYGALFIGTRSHQSNETIFAKMTGKHNAPERTNYPISTDMGSTGNCPSGNLVDAYEYKTGEQFSWESLPPGADPYTGRDPRLALSIVFNNSTWNNRTIECWHGGMDGINKTNATSTGYYLKKFLTDKLTLNQNQTAVHSWILFRYAEILLNFAEAVNEGYGFDEAPFGNGRNARWAINLVRNRAGIAMPPVIASDYASMKEKIKHERRIELAFEEHRFWDVRRWGLEDAKTALGTPLKGIRIFKHENKFSYNPFNVEMRVFSEKMLRYPIPQSEILLSNGVLKQNDNW